MSQQEKDQMQELILIRLKLCGQSDELRKLTEGLLAADQNKKCEHLETLKLIVALVGNLNKSVEGLLEISMPAIGAVLEEGEPDKASDNELENFKKELISIISHTVRTPLTVIREGLSLVLEELPGKLNDQQKEFLMDVKKNTDNLTNCLEDIFHTPWNRLGSKKKLI